MNEAHANGGRGRRWVRVALVATGATMALVIGGAMVLPIGEATAGFFGRHHDRHSPEAIREKADFVMGWVLSSVDATDEQEAQVSEILDRTLAELAPLRDAREVDRAAFVAAISGPTVNRAALQDLRAEKVADMTVASEQVVEALADIAEVLTQEQRDELIQMAARWHD